MTLQNFLLAILTGSFAVGPAVFMLLERIPAFASVDPEYKRWVVAVLSGIAGLAAWALALRGNDLTLADVDRAVAEGRAPREAAEWVGLWLPCAVRAAARQLAGVAAVRPARAGAAASEERAA